MKKMPTAENLINDYTRNSDGYSANVVIDVEDAIQFAKDFAKLHVKVALEAALEEVPYGCSDPIHYDDVKGILTCYPESNIK